MQIYINNIKRGKSIFHNKVCYIKTQIALLLLNILPGFDLQIHFKMKASKSINAYFMHRNASRN